MRQAPSLLDQVLSWASLEQSARHRRAEASACPWWRFFEWSGLRREAQRTRQFADGRKQRLPDDAVKDVAEHLVRVAWAREAQDLTTKNPYHPALATQRHALVPALLEQIRAEPLRGPQHLHVGVDVSEVPGLSEFLTEQFAESVLDEAAQRLYDIASDPVFLHKEQTFEDGRDILQVQHKASGLRATFTTTLDSPTIGTVHSKPYKISSIDPDQPGQCLDWQTYAGLGIGTRIYEEAARLRPTVRWGGGVTSVYSAAVRRKLHANDPYRWAGSCDWCSAQGIQWETATHAAFQGHP